VENKQPSWLKPAIDWGPLIAFFVTFKLYGLMPATGVLIAATAVLTALGYAMLRRIAPMPLITMGVVAVFGGLTLWFQDETFIKMKPTIIMGLFSAALLIGMALGRPLVKYVMESALDLDDAGWRKLTFRFAIFFAFIALLNEVVWRTQSTDLWVDFKVFGIVGLNIVFILSQMPMIMRHQTKPPSE
jgi:intracellular septation protein